MKKFSEYYDPNETLCVANIDGYLVNVFFDETKELGVTREEFRIIFLHANYVGSLFLGSDGYFRIYDVKLIPINDKDRKNN